MSGVSSIGSSMTAASYSPLDKNQDGVVDAQELQEAAQSGLLSASILNDEDSDSSSDPSATDVFSGNLASMLLQMQQNSQSSSSTDGSSDESPMDLLFASLDTDKDGKVSQDEFVAGRPKDMSESDAESLFKSLDTQNAGSLDKDQFAEGLDVLKSSDTSAADMLSLEPSTSDTNPTDAATLAENQAFDVLLNGMQNPSSLYQNTYGQYDLDQTDGIAALSQ